jgi:hypothetical protein
MRVFVIFFASLLICGCGRWGDLSYQPVSLYQEDDVGSLSRNLNGAANAKDYAFEVIQITNYRCDLFFESLDRLRGDSDFALARIAAVSTGLPPILQAAHSSATAIANVSAALGFATGVINDYKQYYLLADFKPEIYKKWQTFRAVQQAAIEGSIAVNTSIPEAKLRLYEYVRMCLPSQLKQWIYESASSSSTTPRLLSAPTGSTSRALAVPRAGRPGPIVID